MRTVTLLVLLATALLGCPPSDAKKGDRAPKPCAKVGDSCEFSPGKLGTCVSKDDCATPPCLTCQSQH